MEQDFLLRTEMAKRLYLEGVRNLPIIDYHNHLSVEEILQDQQFVDITEMWITKDPYKHRAMRICGVDEKYITGDASNKEKFIAWCTILPKLVGNPLYHWADMEMRQVFGWEQPLCQANSEEAWEWLNEKLQEKQFSAQGILEQFHVEYAAPCCGVLDDVSGYLNVMREMAHDRVSDTVGNMRLAPSFRGDGILPLTQTFLNQLEQKSSCVIENLSDLRKVLAVRLDVFHQAGCRFSDHALDAGCSLLNHALDEGCSFFGQNLDVGFHYFADDGENERRLEMVLDGSVLKGYDRMALDSEVLRILASEYTKRGWIMQLHIGALRQTSDRLKRIAGPAGGYAGIGTPDVENIAGMLRDLENRESLPRTILFTLNPAVNEALSILSGSFVEPGIRGKVQQGSAWWWCDHIKGITDVLETISAYSVLSVFYGMTTDSRSLLSFVRHDYFRRILCGWMGDKVERMELPDDFELLKEIAVDICYGNLKRFLSEGGIEKFQV